MNEKKNFLS